MGEEWRMTAAEKDFLGELPDSVGLYYVGDGNAGAYYLTEERARDAVLAYAYVGLVTRMWLVDFSRDDIQAVDLQRGAVQVGPRIRDGDLDDAIELCLEGVYA